MHLERDSENLGGGLDIGNKQSKVAMLSGVAI